MVAMFWMKRLIPLTFFLFLTFSVFARPASASDLSSVPLLGGLWNAVQCGTDLNCLVRGASVSGENFAFHTVIGKDANDVTKADLQTMLDGKWDLGFVGATDNLLASLYSNPPDVHLATYFQNKLANNILASPAQATVGTDFLDPILPLWTAMRNLAYGLFLIVVVAIGLMIMFRKEISPRVTISFINALPKIVIGLVLITFSYPLIALAVDVGLVLGSELVRNALNTAFSQTPISLNAPFDVAGNLKNGLASGDAGQVVGAALAGVGAIKDALLSLGLMLIFAVAALIIFFLASLRLIISYFKIVMSTIFSPIIILFGSLPGQEGIITNLGKDVLVNVLTFPATLFFLMLGVWFAGPQSAQFSTAFLGSPANISIKAASLVVSFIPIGSILALLTVLLAWKAPSMIEEALGGGKPKGKR